ncbi:asparaginyl-tRNA synthetase [Dacryopinax primogenitus]|uniref:asparagine--tRNA ligase n=1 Tax=Dacryopinax primogenitus (strain DJM 731) TaxID=1858805 RepID=M5G1Z8_DACPD|nr:asparaginyl-tRNA synthetase [Dacryopinax primogenitus]EJU02240.1 asparaginyl-tRNA synthetase [Dacryopinax primogenitus]
MSSLAGLRLPPTIQQLLASAPETPSSDETDNPSNAPTPQRARTIYGHLTSLRVTKRTAFLHLSDGSTHEPLQAVLRPREAEGMSVGCSVRLEGELVRSRGSGQEWEFSVKEGGARVVGALDVHTYPLQNKQIRPETLRENAHLRARLPTGISLLRVRSLLAREIHAWFEENDFWNVNVPILTGSDCEGAGEVFSVKPYSMGRDAASVSSPAPSTSENQTSTELASPEPTPPSSTPSARIPSAPKPHSVLHASQFFHRPAYLTVSGQLHLEALTPPLSRVYTLSPCFRAEPSLTHRHLAEFWMLEAEMGWVEPPAGLEGVMDVLEGSVKRVLGSLLSNSALRADVQLLRSSSPSSETDPLAPLLTWSSTPWPRISYTHAISLLQRAKAEGTHFEYDPKVGEGLQSEHEKYLAGLMGPVFVTRYPRGLKPFYMRITEPETSEEGEIETVECFDLLVPHIGELAGGSLRESRLPMLEASLAAHGLSREEYAWYLDLRRWGGVPTGGYGMGWERLVSWVTGIESVRDCIPFPRWAGNMVL